MLRPPGERDTDPALSAVGMAARELQDWLVDHPCPEPNWSDQLSMVAAQCAFATLTGTPPPGVRGLPASERLDRCLEKLDTLVAEAHRTAKGRART